jgi:alanyl-tRNA synthetase
MNTKKYSPEEIRSLYLSFFKERGHFVIESASLIPENDPTTLFTGSGMQPLVPYLLGENHPKGVRLVNSQKCFRSGDIEEIGDNRHSTFFEMLGNWSLGDYGKKEQIPFFFSFLVDVIGLSPEKLFVTVFRGDEKLGIKKDEESILLWQDLFKKRGVSFGVQDIGSEEEGYIKGMENGARIFLYDAGKNWWSRSGRPENMPVGEPGGPDTEVFYDFALDHKKEYGEKCHPNCDCGRFLEIGNSVFMQYQKNKDASFSKLPKQNVDFGGGLERIGMAQHNTPDIFLVNHKEILEYIAKMSGKKYEENTQAFRIIADHAKASVFLIESGVLPSTTERGYFVRRLLRRAIRFGDTLGIEKEWLSGLVECVCVLYQNHYPSLLEKKEMIQEVLHNEEVKFRTTLQKGLMHFEKTFSQKESLSGKDIFLLFSTYGFPFELIEEIAKEKNISLDKEGFSQEQKKHQDISRKGVEQKFKGGLGDHSEMSVKYHTTTHLLHQALKEVLGNSVEQRGSNITPERLRFDFSHHQKMTEEEKKKVEKIVNEKIEKDLPVSFEDIPLKEAEKRGAIGLFGEKYDDIVRVYSIGNFSLEFCGGPHIERTGVLGKFRIIKEEASASGIRRIKAILE